jgi:hypothetical protein
MLLARILFLEEANQTLLQRFQVSETLIQQLGEQIINNTDSVAAVNEDVINQSSRIEQLQREIIALEGLSLRLDSLTAKDTQLEEEVIKIDSLRVSIEAITAELYTVRNELLRIDSDSKKTHDVTRLTLEDLNAVLRRLDEVEINQVAKLTLEDLAAVLSRLDEVEINQSTKLTLEDLTAVLNRLDGVEINQSTKLDSQDLDVVLQRLDELETIQPELGDRNLLRDRLDEVLYQQSLIAEDLERLNRIEDKLMSLEEKFNLDQMSSDREATPMSSSLTEGTPPAQPVGE